MHYFGAPLKKVGRNAYKYNVCFETCPKDQKLSLHPISLWPAFIIAPGYRLQLQFMQLHVDTSDLLYGMTLNLNADFQCSILNFE